MRVRLTVEVEIRESACKAVKMTPKQVMEALVAEESDVIDGIEIFPRQEKYEIVSHFCLSSPQLVKVEAVE